ncbi:sensor histidine kinase [Actinoplanes friuliensis]|uniref:histidine kinase n=1 Tax=Actinoplanes friuliensis DSM 7358 TaxID=1246995 RepID=U5W3T3_9ACTN|nr:HAMP domain-containing sensor histidine kinase [Actinoplanes friuliensis]AGZ43794.1 histidine kinase [Actinoplanes friuliensis DSM 7358]
MGATRVPLHRSLLTRLLATSLAVAVCAVAATAWLAVRTTSRVIRQEQGQSIAADSRIYDGLLGYAATHASWQGVEPVLTELAAGTGRQVTLTDAQGRWLAGRTGELPSRPSAVVDALHVDTALRGGTNATEIDPRAVGPFRLTAAERAVLRKAATAQIACLEDIGFGGVLTESPSGRVSVSAQGDLDTQGALFKCDRGIGPTSTEKRALDKLTGLVTGCVERQGARISLQLSADFSYRAKTGPGVDDGQIRDCLDAARREQLRPYVAPAARLYMGSPARQPDATFDLTGRNAGYVAGVTGLVLLLAVLVTVLVGLRLVRPLRVLTAAAQRPLDRDAPVPVTGDDEIGRLAAAFNDLAERRQVSERRRKAMVSDVAHELRTPLSNIRIWLEAAQDGLAPLDPELLDLLTEEALLLQHVIDDLRDLAAADAGSLRLHPSRVHVEDLLRQVAEAQRETATRGGVDLRLELAGDPEVELDPVRLRQIVGNLLSNAVRHTPPGGRVVLRSRIAGDELLVEVADTGSGIAPQDLPHVFDRFWRADKARSRQTGGSGLGLAIARKLAREHGGDLTAASRPGAGSTFTLRLPSRG